MRKEGGRTSEFDLKLFFFLRVVGVELEAGECGLNVQGRVTGASSAWVSRQHLVEKVVRPVVLLQLLVHRGLLLAVRDHA
jgi:hypothetical protein